jgi:DNA-binding IclR family transcriptional regulator
MQFATGHLVTAALYGVTKLGIPDLLKAGPKCSADLAREVGANEDALFRVMRTLASHGIFREVMARTFALTPVS